MELRDEILLLEDTLKQKRRELFQSRLLKLIGLTDQELADSGISKIEISHEQHDTSEWKITYVHTTNEYDENNYAYSDDNSDTETKEIATSSKTTNMRFGHSISNYFMQGSNRNRFNIYTKNETTIRIINKDYTMDLDISDQTKLMYKYSKNKHIPEWLAIRTFLAMNDNGWNNKDMFVYMSVV